MRTKNAILNFVTSYLFYFITAILGFVKISLFIKYLGESVYSLNQLYLNVFQYISLLEAGIGAALTYRLYKLIADHNYESVNRLCAGTKSILSKIGILIVGVGFIVSFVIPVFIKDNIFSMIYINVTFMLYIIKNCVDYFMFTPRFVIQADQKMYKINVFMYLFRVMEVGTEIIFIILGYDYILILIPGIFIRIVSNLMINKKVYKEYPWFNKKAEKDLAVKNDISNLFVHRIVGLIFNNIDIVIISSFLGSFYVTVYSVYNYIVKYTTDTISQIFNAIKDGIGNAINVESKENIVSILNQIFTMFDFFSVLFVLGFYFVLDEFVVVWVGKQYVVDNITLILFLFLIYFNTNIKSSEIIKNVLGLFKETKKMAMLGAIINLVLSLILVKIIGLKGVLLGTVIASCGTDLWYLPYITNKKLFGYYNPIKLLIHIKNFMFICIGIVVITPISKWILNVISITNLGMWILYSICIGSAVVIYSFIVFYIGYKDFKVSLKRLKNIKVRK